MVDGHGRRVRAARLRSDQLRWVEGEYLHGPERVLRMDGYVDRVRRMSVWFRWVVKKGDASNVRFQLREVPARVPGWEVLGDFDDRTDRPVISCVTVRPIPDGVAQGVDPLPEDGVTSAVLRGIPLNAVHLALDAVISGSNHADMAPRANAHSPAEEGEANGTVARTGRPRRDPDKLRGFAERYLVEVREGSGVYERLARLYDFAPETARTWTKAARREGWLSPGRPGLRTATPGPRLMQAREENGQ